MQASMHAIKTVLRTIQKKSTMVMVAFFQGNINLPRVTPAVIVSIVREDLEEIKFLVP